MPPGGWGRDREIGPPVAQVGRGAGSGGVPAGSREPDRAGSATSLGAASAAGAAGPAGSDGTASPDEVSRETSGVDPPQPSGVDLARAALASARSEARRKGVARRTGSATRRDAATRRSGSGPDERDPQPLGRSIDRLVTERGWETPAAVAGVFGRWDAVVGPEVAAHCVPEQYTEGEVVVRTDSTAWATQVRLLGPAIVRRLNEELGDGTVRRIRVLGPSGPSWRKGPLRAPGSRGPRDTYG